MLINYKVLLRTIAIGLVFCFGAEQACWAAPSSARPVPVRAPLKTAVTLAEITRNPYAIDIPWDAVSLKEIHQGSNGKLIVHIQDAHTNLSGQKNLAAALDHLMGLYGMPLVLSEGSDRDVSLGQIRGAMKPEALERGAERLLYEGLIAGHEFLNLTGERPMKIIGVEDEELYDQNLAAYADLAQKRSDVLIYLRDIRNSVERLKNNIYPKTLLDLEKKTSSKDENFKETLALLFGLSKEAGIDQGAYPEISKIRKVMAFEELLDFERINAEQAQLLEAISVKAGREAVQEMVEVRKEGAKDAVTQRLLLEKIFRIAESADLRTKRFAALHAYGEYLKLFSDIRMHRLFDEMEIMEEQIYEALLEDENHRVVRAIDRYLTLLDKAYAIQMNTREFGEFRHSDVFADSASWQAYLNRELAGVGYLDDLIVFEEHFKNAQEAIGGFYSVVDKRDLAFMKNIGRVLAEEEQDAAFLVAGGYHTDHVTRLLKDEGYSYVVLTPMVNDETDHKRYEKILLAALDHSGNDAHAGQKTVDALVPALAADKRAVSRLSGFASANRGNDAASLAMHIIRLIGGQLELQAHDAKPIPVPPLAPAQPEEVPEEEPVPAGTHAGVAGEVLLSASRMAVRRPAELLAERQLEDIEATAEAVFPESYERIEELIESARVMESLEKRQDEQYYRQLPARRIVDGKFKVTFDEIEAVLTQDAARLSDADVEGSSDQDFATKVHEVIGRMRAHGAFDEKMKLFCHELIMLHNEHDFAPHVIADVDDLRFLTGLLLGPELNAMAADHAPNSEYIRSTVSGFVLTTAERAYEVDFSKPSTALPMLAALYPDDAGDLRDRQKAFMRVSFPRVVSDYIYITNYWPAVPAEEDFMILLEVFAEEMERPGRDVLLLESLGHSLAQVLLYAQDFAVTEKAQHRAQTLFVENPLAAIFIWAVDHRHLLMDEAVSYGIQEVMRLRERLPELQGDARPMETMGEFFLAHAVEKKPALGKDLMNLAKQEIGDLNLPIIFAGDPDSAPYDNHLRKMEHDPARKEVHDFLMDNRKLKRFMEIATVVRNYFPYRLRPADVTQNPLDFAIQNGMILHLEGDLYLSPVTGGFKRHHIFRMDADGNVTYFAGIKMNGRDSGNMSMFNLNGNNTIDAYRELHEKFEASWIEMPELIALLNVKVDAAEEATHLYGRSWDVTKHPLLALVMEPPAASIRLDTLRPSDLPVLADAYYDGDQERLMDDLATGVLRPIAALHAVNRVGIVDGASDYHTGNSGLLLPDENSSGLGVKVFPVLDLDSVVKTEGMQDFHERQLEGIETVIGVPGGELMELGGLHPPDDQRAVERYLEIHDREHLVAKEHLEKTDPAAAGDLAGADQFDDKLADRMALFDVLGLGVLIGGVEKGDMGRVAILDIGGYGINGVACALKGATVVGIYDRADKLSIARFNARRHSDKDGVDVINKIHYVPADWPQIPANQIPTGVAFRMAMITDNNDIDYTDRKRLVEDLLPYLAKDMAVVNIHNDTASDILWQEEWKVLLPALGFHKVSSDPQTPEILAAFRKAENASPPAARLADVTMIEAEEGFDDLVPFFTGSLMNLRQIQALLDRTSSALALPLGDQRRLVGDVIERLHRFDDLDEEGLRRQAEDLLFNWFLHAEEKLLLLQLWETALNQDDYQTQMNIMEFVAGHPQAEWTGAAMSSGVFAYGAELEEKVAGRLRDKAEENVAQHLDIIASMKGKKGKPARFFDTKQKLLMLNPAISDTRIHILMRLAQARRYLQELRQAGAPDHIDEETLKRLQAWVRPFVVLSYLNNAPYLKGRAAFASIGVDPMPLDLTAKNAGEMLEQAETILLILAGSYVEDEANNALSVMFEKYFEVTRRGEFALRGDLRGVFRYGYMLLTMQGEPSKALKRRRQNGDEGTSYMITNEDVQNLMPNKLLVGRMIRCHPRANTTLDRVYDVMRALSSEGSFSFDAVPANAEEGDAERFKRIVDAVIDGRHLKRAVEIVSTAEAINGNKELAERIANMNMEEAANLVLRTQGAPAPWHLKGAAYDAARVSLRLLRLQSRPSEGLKAERRSSTESADREGAGQQDYAIRDDVAHLMHISDMQVTSFEMGLVVTPSALLLDHLLLAITSKEMGLSLPGKSHAANRRRPAHSGQVLPFFLNETNLETGKLLVQNVYPDGRYPLTGRSGTNGDDLTPGEVAAVLIPKKGQEPALARRSDVRKRLGSGISRFMKEHGIEVKFLADALHMALHATDRLRWDDTRSVGLIRAHNTIGMLANLAGMTYEETIGEIFQSPPEAAARLAERPRRGEDEPAFDRGEEPGKKATRPGFGMLLKRGVETGLRVSALLFYGAAAAFITWVYAEGYIGGLEFLLYGGTASVAFIAWVSQFYMKRLQYRFEDRGVQVADFEGRKTFARVLFRHWVLHLVLRAARRAFLYVRHLGDLSFLDPSSENFDVYQWYRHSYSDSFKREYALSFMRGVSLTGRHLEAWADRVLRPLNPDFRVDEFIGPNERMESKHFTYLEQAINDQILIQRGYVVSVSSRGRTVLGRITNTTQEVSPAGRHINVYSVRIISKEAAKEYGFANGRGDVFMIEGMAAEQIEKNRIALEELKQLRELAREGLAKARQAYEYIKSVIKNGRQALDAAREQSEMGDEIALLTTQVEALESTIESKSEEIVSLEEKCQLTQNHPTLLVLEALFRDVEINILESRQDAATLLEELSHADTLLVAAEVIGRPLTYLGNADIAETRRLLASLVKPGSGLEQLMTLVPADRLNAVLWGFLELEGRFRAATLSNDAALLLIPRNEEVPLEKITLRMTATLLKIKVEGRGISNDEEYRRWFSDFVREGIDDYQAFNARLQSMSREIYQESFYEPHERLAAANASGDESASRMASDARPDRDWKFWVRAAGWVGIISTAYASVAGLDPAVFVSYAPIMFLGWVIAVFTVISSRFRDNLWLQVAIIGLPAALVVALGFQEMSGEKLAFMAMRAASIFFGVVVFKRFVDRVNRVNFKEAIRQALRWTMIPALMSGFYIGAIFVPWLNEGPITESLRSSFDMGIATFLANVPVSMAVLLVFGERKDLWKEIWKPEFWSLKTNETFRGFINFLPINFLYWFPMLTIIYPLTSGHWATLALSHSFVTFVWIGFVKGYVERAFKDVGARLADKQDIAGKEQILAVMESVMEQGVPVAGAPHAEAGLEDQERIHVRLLKAWEEFARNEDAGYLWAEINTSVYELNQVEDIYVKDGGMDEPQWGTLTAVEFSAFRVGAEALLEMVGEYSSGLRGVLDKNGASEALLKKIDKVRIDHASEVDDSMLPDMLLEMGDSRSLKSRKVRWKQLSPRVIPKDVKTDALLQFGRIWPTLPEEKQNQLLPDVLAVFGAILNQRHGNSRYIYGAPAMAALQTMQLKDRGLYELLLDLEPVNRSQQVAYAEVLGDTIVSAAPEYAAEEAAAARERIRKLFKLDASRLASQDPHDTFAPKESRWRQLAEEALKRSVDLPRIQKEYGEIFYLKSPVYSCEVYALAEEHHAARALQRGAQWVIEKGGAMSAVPGEWVFAIEEAQNRRAYLERKGPSEDAGGFGISIADELGVDVINPIANINRWSVVQRVVAHMRQANFEYWMEPVLGFILFLRMRDNKHSNLQSLIDSGGLDDWMEKGGYNISNLSLMVDMQNMWPDRNRMQRDLAEALAWVAANPTDEDLVLLKEYLETHPDIRNLFFIIGRGHLPKLEKFFGASPVLIEGPSASRLAGEMTRRQFLPVAAAGALTAAVAGSTEGAEKPAGIRRTESWDFYRSLKYSDKLTANQKKWIAVFKRILENPDEKGIQYIKSFFDQADGGKEVIEEKYLDYVQDMLFLAALSANGAEHAGFWEAFKEMLPDDFAQDPRNRRRGRFLGGRFYKHPGWNSLAVWLMKNAHNGYSGYGSESYYWMRNVARIAVNSGRYNAVTVQSVTGLDIALGLPSYFTEGILPHLGVSAAGHLTFVYPTRAVDQKRMKETLQGAGMTPQGYLMLRNFAEPRSGALDEGFIKTAEALGLETLLELRADERAAYPLAQSILEAESWGQEQTLHQVLQSGISEGEQEALLMHLYDAVMTTDADRQPVVAVQERVISHLISNRRIAEIAGLLTYGHDETVKIFAGQLQHALQNEIPRRAEALADAVWRLPVLGAGGTLGSGRGKKGASRKYFDPAGISRAYEVVLGDPAQAFLRSNFSETMTRNSRKELPEGADPDRLAWMRIWARLTATGEPGADLAFRMEAGDIASSLMEKAADHAQSVLPEEILPALKSGLEYLRRTTEAINQQRADRAGGSLAVARHTTIARRALAFLAVYAVKTPDEKTREDARLLAADYLVLFEQIDADEGVDLKMKLDVMEALGQFAHSAAAGPAGLHETADEVTGKILRRLRERLSSIAGSEPDSLLTVAVFYLRTLQSFLTRYESPDAATHPDAGAVYSAAIGLAEVTGALTEDFPIDGVLRLLERYLQIRDSAGNHVASAAQTESIRKAMESMRLQRSVFVSVDSGARLATVQEAAGHIDNAVRSLLNVYEILQFPSDDPALLYGVQLLEAEEPERANLFDEALAEHNRKKHAEWVDLLGPLTVQVLYTSRMAYLLQIYRGSISAVPEDESLRGQFVQEVMGMRMNLQGDIRMMTSTLYEEPDSDAFTENRRLFAEQYGEETDSETAKALLTMFEEADKHLALASDAIQDIPAASRLSDAIEFDDANGFSAYFDAQINRAEDLDSLTAIWAKANEAFRVHEARLRIAEYRLSDLGREYRMTFTALSEKALSTAAEPAELMMVWEKMKQALLSDDDTSSQGKKQVLNLNLGDIKRSFRDAFIRVHGVSLQRMAETENPVSVRRTFELALTEMSEEEMELSALGGGEMFPSHAKSDFISGYVKCFEKACELTLKRIQSVDELDGEWGAVVDIRNQEGEKRIPNYAWSKIRGYYRKAALRVYEFAFWKIAAGGDEREIPTLHQAKRKAMGRQFAERHREAPSTSEGELAALLEAVRQRDKELNATDMGIESWEWSKVESFRKAAADPLHAARMADGDARPEAEPASRMADAFPVSDEATRAAVRRLEQLLHVFGISSSGDIEALQDAELNEVVDRLVGRREKDNVRLGAVEELLQGPHRDALRALPEWQEIQDIRFGLEMVRTAGEEGIVITPDTQVGLFIGERHIVGGYYYRLFQNVIRNVFGQEINLAYLPFAIRADEDQTADRLDLAQNQLKRNGRIAGSVVTRPWKRTFYDAVDVQQTDVDVVNYIVRDPRTTELTGYTTDGRAWRLGLNRDLGNDYDFGNKQVVMIGAGDAASEIAAELNQEGAEGVRKIVFADRHSGAFEPLRQMGLTYQTDFIQLGDLEPDDLEGRWLALEEAIRGADMVINATGLGRLNSPTEGKNPLRDESLDVFHEGQVVSELNSRGDTQFLKDAVARGVSPQHAVRGRSFFIYGFVRFIGGWVSALYPDKFDDAVEAELYPAILQTLVESDAARLAEQADLSLFEQKIPGTKSPERNGADLRGLLPAALRSFSGFRIGEALRGLLDRIAEKSRYFGARMALAQDNQYVIAKIGERSAEVETADGQIGPILEFARARGQRLTARLARESVMERAKAEDQVDGFNSEAIAGLLERLARERKETVTFEFAVEAPLMADYDAESLNEIKQALNDREGRIRTVMTAFDGIQPMFREQGNVIRIVLVSRKTARKSEALDLPSGDVSLFVAGREEPKMALELISAALGAMELHKYADSKDAFRAYQESHILKTLIQYTPGLEEALSMMHTLPRDSRETMQAAILKITNYPILRRVLHEALAAAARMAKTVLWSA